MGAPVLMLSRLTLACNALAILGGLTGYILSLSPATLGFVLENTFSLISAMIMSWRFRDAGGIREERALLAVSFCQIGLALTIGIIAVAHIWAPLIAENSIMVLSLSLPSFMAFAVLATAKFYFAFKGDLGSLMRDAACSLALKEAFSASRPIHSLNRCSDFNSAALLQCVRQIDFI